MHGGEVERGGPPPVHRVHRALVLQQQLLNTQTSTLTSDQPTEKLVCDLLVIFECCLGALISPGGSGAVQRGPVVVVLMVDEGAVYEKELHRIGHPGGGGQVQPRVVVLVLVVNRVLVLAQ